MATPVLIVGPQQPVVTLEEMKEHLRVDADDEDALIAGLRDAATEWVQTATDRQFVAATWRLSRDRFHDIEIELPWPPLRSVASVKYYDTDNALRTLGTATYEVVTWKTPGRIRLAFGFAWPATAIRQDAVKVEFVAGYGSAADVPEMAKAAIKLLAAHWHENRETVGVANAAELPMGVQAIVQSLRAYRF